MTKLHLSYKDLDKACSNLGSFLRAGSPLPALYGVPRGGIYAALMMMKYDITSRMLEDSEYAEFIVDDIIDTGATASRYPSNIPFLALVGREGVEYPPNVVVGMRVPVGQWIVFPWESAEEEQRDNSIVGTIRNRLLLGGVKHLANDNIAPYLYPEELPLLQDEVERRVQALLDALLIDTANDHNTNETAKRVAKMYLRETFSGRYEQMPRITTFPNVKHLDELYTTGPISVRSTCSHHLAPIFGKCWIGVIPGNEVIGLSKFNRLVDWVMSRPQIQEEAVMQLADILENYLQPKGLAVIVKATHTCMTQRGVKEHGDAVMTTSVMRGAMRDNDAARAEFLALIK